MWRCALLLQVGTQSTTLEMSEMAQRRASKAISRLQGDFANEPLRTPIETRFAF
jgi:hypothetical protein